jgi:DNA polymerase III epsilon subunit-like protein
MLNVMLDLETLGTKPGCPVLSIGAVTFDPDMPDSGTHFYEVCGLREQFAAGLVPDADTLAWWTQQSNAAAMFSGLANASASVAFTRFQNWFPSDALVWGNGADFDMPILAKAMQALGYTAPWKPFSGRCFRTLKNLYPHVPKVQPTEAHNALSDALAQAQWALNIAEAGAKLA